MPSSDRVKKTQVGIIGAGPAGLVLSHRLYHAGIDSIVLESRSRAHVEGRIRAGVLEQNTVDFLTSIGVADRLHKEGLVHHGVEFRFNGQSKRIPLTDLTGGRAIYIYGQRQILKDLIKARLDTGGVIFLRSGSHENRGAPRQPTHLLRTGRRRVRDSVRLCGGLRRLSWRLSQIGSRWRVKGVWPRIRLWMGRDIGRCSTFIRGTDLRVPSERICIAQLAVPIVQPFVRPI